MFSFFHAGSLDSASLTNAVNLRLRSFLHPGSCFAYASLQPQILGYCACCERSYLAALQSSTQFPPRCTHWYPVRFGKFFLLQESTWNAQSLMSDSSQHRGLQPTRLLCPLGFSRQEYWSGLPFPLPGDLPDPGLNLHLFCRQADS